jgi:hypothetical protein
MRANDFFLNMCKKSFLVLSFPHTVYSHALVILKSVIIRITKYFFNITLMDR